MTAAIILIGSSQPRPAPPSNWPVTAAAGASWGRGPCPGRPAAPGCSSGGGRRRRWPPPPARRGRPRQAGSRWPSSPPCPGRRGRRPRCGGSGPRTPPSRLEIAERREKKEVPGQTQYSASELLVYFNSTFLSFFVLMLILYSHAPFPIKNWRESKREREREREMGFDTERECSPRLTLPWQDVTCFSPKWRTAEAAQNKGPKSI